MMKKEDLARRFSEGRTIEMTDLAVKLSKPKKTGDEQLDIINLLRGTWVSQAEGWNLIALPASPLDLADPPQLPDKPFRLLMNQFGETLKFNVPDMGVPNRGVTLDSAGGQTDRTDDEPHQLIDAITYEQIIVQKAVADFPASNHGVNAENGEPIHHEPGFFMQFLNHVLKGKSPDVTNDAGDEVEKDLTIARMGTIPHGNSVLAMGFVTHDKTIEDDNAFPERLKVGDLEKQDVKDSPYLTPYQHFIDHHFYGCVDPDKVHGFPGFSPDNVHAILQFAQNNLFVSKTTVLNFDTKFKVDGIDDALFDPNGKPISGFPISNVPFVKREANVTEMHATFWIMELEKTDQCAPPEFVMQYSQTVYLEFFDSPVEQGRRIRWPHVSINTLRKVPA